MSAIEQLVSTAEDLLRLPTGLGERFELVEGELRTMSPGGSLHGKVAARAALLLGQHVAARHLGEVVGAETGFVLKRNPDTVRAPDAAFIAAVRVPAGGLPETYFDGAPDLAVEVVSPGDTAQDVQSKVTDWLQAGTRMVWVLYPKSRQVFVFRAGGRVDALAADALLDGDDVLPGFACPVRDLFE